MYIRPLTTHFNNFRVTTTAEFLYFDYNYQVGDTFLLPFADLGNSDEFSVHAVTGIDSIMIGNVLHKRFAVSVVSGFLGGYSFIEGLGGYEGPIIVPWQWAFQGRLICFMNKGVNPISGYANCEHMTELYEPKPKSGFGIFPNPASDYVTISYVDKPGKSFQALIRDLQGRKIIGSSLFKDKTKLNVQALHSGVYILQILDSYGNIQKTEKLLIRH